MGSASSERLTWQKERTQGTCSDHLWTHTNDVTEHLHCCLLAGAAEHSEGSKDPGRLEHGTEFKDGIALESGEPAVPRPREGLSG